jgi:hypothetical protein
MKNMNHIHQADRKVAPFNQNPRWPAGYFEVLAELKIPTRQHSFYAQWVRQFFNAELHGRRRRDLGWPDIHHFLDTLACAQDAEPWQVAQAKEALLIYYEQFRGIRIEETGQETSPEPRDLSAEKQEKASVTTHTAERSAIPLLLRTTLFDGVLTKLFDGDIAVTITDII